MSISIQFGDEGTLAMNQALTICNMAAGHLEATFVSAHFRAYSI